MTTPTPFPVPLPVSFGPHEADWWMVWVTGAGVVVTLFVAISAVFTARSAKNMAKDTEDARQTAEMHRAQREYAFRLDDALAALLTEIAAYFAPLRDWLDEEDEASLHNRVDQFGELVVSAVPQLDAVDARAQIVRMVAVKGDAEVAREIAHTIAAIRNLPPGRRTAPLQGLVHVIREWRAGERPPQNAIDWLRQFQANNDPRR